MRGQDLASMKKMESCSRRSDLHLMIFTEEKELAMIFLPIAFWLWMPQLEKGSGIFKQCIMICGIVTCQQRLFLFLSKKTVSRLTLLRKRPSPDLFFYSTGKQEILFTRSMKPQCRRLANYRVKKYLRLNRFPLFQNHLH